MKLATEEEKKKKQNQKTARSDRSTLSSSNFTALYRNLELRLIIWFHLGLRSNRWK